MNKKNRTYLNSIHLLLLVGFIFNSCSEPQKNNMIEDPYSDESSPLKYVDLNKKNIYILTYGTSLSYPSIIEIPIEKINRKVFSEVRYYSFDIEAGDNNPFKRNERELQTSYRSVYRNVREFVIPLKVKNTSNLKNISVFNNKAYQNNVKENISENNQFRYTYFIYDPEISVMKYVNPYDGFNKDEKETLKWIRDIVSKISPYELRYCDLVEGISNELSYYFDSTRVNSYLLKADDIYR
nr:hypothetical protein [uncultured Fluviicola sp.]